MSTFQSYLIINPNPEKAREGTKNLARSFGLDIEKVSTDVYFVQAKKIEISIEQIREVKEHIFQKPLQGKYKIIILENAENATPEAQNALLKILEEPPSHAIIILEVQNKALLLPTILSRLTAIKLKPTKSETKITTVLNLDLESALQEISSLENPQQYLDNQIVALSELLVDLAKEKGKPENASQIQKAIEACAAAKQMIAANVNPTFVLANLVIHLFP